MAVPRHSLRANHHPVRRFATTRPLPGLICVASLVWQLAGCTEAVVDKVRDEVKASAGADPWEGVDLPRVPDPVDDPSDKPGVDKPVPPDPSKGAHIVSVSPDQGPTAGMTEVQIDGVGFEGAIGVFFDESPAVDFMVLDDYSIRATSPPRPAGLVAVSVRLGDEDATEISLPLAFRYQAQVTVQSVTPAQGEVAGGEVVTVTGTGFGPYTHFVFGNRLAIDPLVVDEFTAIVRAPPGLPGLVPVSAAGVDGAATLDAAFRYYTAPILTSVHPAFMTLQGGQQITLHGHGLVAKGAVVSVLTPKGSHKATVHAASIDGTRLTVSTPAIPTPGLHDLRYSNADGSSTLKGAVGCFGPVDPTTGAPHVNQITHVQPAGAPVNLPTEVVVYVMGPIATAATGEVKVWVGGKHAEVLSHDLGPGQAPGYGGTVRIRTPLGPDVGAPSPVAVRLQVGGWETEAAKVFSWLPASARIVSVDPKTVSAGGGTALKVVVGPAAQKLGPAGAMRVGALYASGLQASAPDANGYVTLQAVAPKGSPGPADLRVAFAGGELIAQDALAYTSAAPFVAALMPGRGAQAGGTLVEVVGAGLDKLQALALDGITASSWKLVHPGLVHLRTPKGEPGPADLGVVFQGGLTQLLPNAFVYFDPMAGNMGTWGPPIAGAVNVTVLQANLGGGPVEGAQVLIGSDPKPTHHGLTDDRGQITFSALGLAGPLMVSASKKGYDAGSVVAVNTENITIRLRKLAPPPPSSGNGSGGEDEEDPFPDGAIEGVVINAAKYAQLPAGQCKEHPITAGHCQACKADSECLGALTCEYLDDPMSQFDLGKPAGGDVGGPDLPVEATQALEAQKYCAAPCLEDANCPADFECRAIGWSPGNTRYRCVPRIGKPEIRCSTSSPSMFGGNPDPGPESVADATHKFKIAARLGDLAVACTAGYVDAKTSVFVPLIMGLKRAVTVSPGSTTKGVKVNLNIPLTRRIRVRLSRIPMGPDAVNHERYLLGAIDLGAEGYLPMPEVSTTNLTDVLTLERQPQTFSGPLFDAAYDLYGGISSPTGGSPNSLAAVEDLRPDNADHFAWWPEGEKAPVTAQSMAVPVNDMAIAPGLIVAVGDRGHVGVWGGQSFTAQPTPTLKDLQAVWMAPNGEGFAGGDDGALLRRDTIEGWKSAKSPTKRQIVDLTGRAIDDVWMLTDDNQLHHYDGQGWAAFAGPWPVPVEDPNAWPKKSPARLRAMWQAPTGELFLVGDKGGLVQAKLQTEANGSPAAALTFKTLGSATGLTLRAIWGLSADDFWLAGDRGLLGHRAGTDLTWMETGVDETLYAITGTSTGIHAVGGGGAWVQMDLSGKIHDRSLSKFAVDLKGIAGAQGSLVAAGQPVLVMGPYLEMPYITDPVQSGKIGDRIAWEAAPGVTPTLIMIRIATADYTTRWELFVKGHLTEVQLPSFTAIGGADPLPVGSLRIRLWRIYAPQLTIDHFNHKQLSVWRWVSYAYNWMLTEQPFQPADAEKLFHIPGMPGE